MQQHIVHKDNLATRYIANVNNDKAIRLFT